MYGPAEEAITSVAMVSPCARSFTLEHREGCGLGLAAAALRRDRLLGHELRPGEHRLRRLLRIVGPVAVDWECLPEPY